MQQPKNPVQTEQLQQVEALAQAVLDSGSSRVGRITGEPGTGKTVAGHHLADRFNAIRVCANACVSRKTLLQRLCNALDENERGTSDTLLSRIAARVQDRLVVIDEANHLSWQHMEQLRYLPDEAGAGLILIGTDLLERPFRDGRTVTLLAQLARRIGAKQLRMTAMSSPTEIAAYVIQPRFGKTSKTTAKVFYSTCKGYWGEATELADACERVMQVEQVTALNETVVQAASRWIAQRSQ